MDWVKQALKYQDAYMNGLSNQQVSVPLPNRTPGWRLLASEISCVPDVEYPWDPQIVKQIADWSGGNLSPIWIKRVYGAPHLDAQAESGVVIIGRHGLGQADVKGSPRQLFHVPMPSGHVPFKKPTHVYWEPWGEADPRARDLPGAYVPFDSRFIKQVKASYRELDVYAYQAQIRARADQHETNLRRTQLEHEYRADKIRKYAKKKLENISEYEMRDHFLGRWERLLKQK